jgi:hypothetical protein
MIIQKPWQSLYRLLDDETLVALASAGLLRRATKDLETAKIEWHAPPGDNGGEISVDGQLVRFGTSGPKGARCDCPAPGICKHILSASLWLRALPEEGPATPAVDPLAEVLALDVSATFKTAGKAAVRKAVSLMASSGSSRISVQGGVLLIELPEMEFVCRYVAGAGFSGMVSELTGPNRAVMHLLAVAVAWRENGRSFAWPAEAGSSEPPDGAVGRLSSAEATFLERVRVLLFELCESGWSHVSDIMPAQLRALGMSARIESFPRLAGMIHNLAGTVALLARRDFSSDERQAIRLAARIYALCEALQHAGAEQLPGLRGRVQRSYSSGAELELLPLGSYWWETRSGARGLTSLFWDPAERAVLQSVQARRDASDPGFSRQGAWELHALWTGVGSAKNLTGATVKLVDARVSNDNRVAPAGETRASFGEPWRATDERWSEAGYDDWKELAAGVQRSAGLSGSPLDCVLLRPQSLENPQLDEAHQLLHWGVRDRKGDRLTLRLPYESWNQARFSHIEAWFRSGAAIRGIVARLDRHLHGGIFEPVALVIDDDGILVSVALDFVAPANGKAPSFAARLARLFTSKAELEPVFDGGSPLGWSDSLMDILEGMAMTGRLGFIGGNRQALQAVSAHLRSTGMDTVACALEAYLAAPSAGGALTLLYLCQVCQELDTSFIA